MQDRTIDNALLAVHRRNDKQAELARKILVMRGVALPRCQHDRPLTRGKCARLALSMLPCTTGQVADAIEEMLPGIGRKSAVNRAYCSLLRLEAKGGVSREGRVWKLAP